MVWSVLAKVILLPAPNGTDGMDCAWWDDALADWSLAGVATVRHTDVLECRSTHLTLFAGLERLRVGLLKTSSDSPAKGRPDENVGWNSAVSSASGVDSAVALNGAPDAGHLVRGEGE